MIIVRQSTARTILVGPILDASGVAKTDDVVGSIKITKNGTVGAANGSATLTHDHAGKYLLALTASDTDTVGVLQVSLNSGTNDMPVKDCMVLTATAFDTLVANGTLASTTNGRTIDVSAGGEVGLDWANIGSPTTAVAFSNTTISASQVAASVTAGVTISGTTATLDALQTALNTAHGAGSWATATGFSTHSAADVWAVGTRTITGGSLTTAPPTAAAIADAVWDEARTGHTTTGTFGYYLDAAISGISGGGGGSTAADIWAYATRTLTSTLTITTDDIDAIVAGVTAAGPGLYNVIRNDDLTLRIGDEFTQAITGLGNLSTRDDLVFTLKASETDADTAAKIYLSENNGLTRLNGATYGTAANGSITVDDATNGDITIRISSAATASLTKATRVDAVKVLESGGNDRTPRVGKTQVLPVIVEARG